MQEGISSLSNLHIPHLFLNLFDIDRKTNLKRSYGSGVHKQMIGLIFFIKNDMSIVVLHFLMKVQYQMFRMVI